MRRDAESHAEEDKTRREEVELRNEADNTVYRSEKFVKDNGEKLGESKSGIESALASVKDSLKGSDSAAIRSALDKLNETLQTASAGMYQRARHRRIRTGRRGKRPRFLRRWRTQSRRSRSHHRRRGGRRKEEGLIPSKPILLSRPNGGLHPHNTTLH